MKKLSLVAILALAFTSFACGDDKKDDDSKNDQQTEKLDNDKACTKHDDCKSAFCQKQDATNSLCKAKIADNGTCKNADDLCSSSGFSCKDEGEGLKCLKSGSQQEKKDNEAACSKHDDCKSAFCQKQDATNSLCKAKIADNGTCKNADDLCSSSGFSCKDEGEGLKCLKASSQEDEPCTGTNEEKIKCYDKKNAKRILACAEADNSVSISDNREDLETRANGTEDYSYLSDARNSRCLSQILAYTECEAKQSCEELLAHWKDSAGNNSDDFGSCKDAFIAQEECITPIAELLCFNRVECSKGEDEDISSEEFQQCFEEAIAITNVECINAKRAYYECMTADSKDFCESDFSDCTDELAAEATACGSGT